MVAWWAGVVVVVALGGCTAAHAPAGPVDALAIDAGELVDALAIDTADVSADALAIDAGELVDALAIDTADVSADTPEALAIDAGDAAVPWPGTWSGGELGAYELDTTLGGDTSVARGSIDAPESLTLDVDAGAAAVTRTTSTLGSCTLHATSAGGGWTYTPGAVCMTASGATATLVDGTLTQGVVDGGVVALESTRWTYSGNDSRGDAFAGSQHSTATLGR